MTIIAIDLGTSNTVVSLLEPDTQQPVSLRFPTISRIFKGKTAQGTPLEVPVVPSLAFVQSPQVVMIGEVVRSQRLGLVQPQRLFKAFKRELAADFQPPPRQIDGHTYSAAAIAEQFLTVLWHHLHQQQIQPSQVILTVPVGAFERYLDWFREVAVHLGIANVQFVDEATAAALGYAIQRPHSLVLVIDFGGGTLDLSLVRITPTSNQVQIAEVLAKADAYLGGEDIDTWIVEDYLQRMEFSRAKIGEVGWQNLVAIAERLKIRLSHQEVAQESWLDEETFMAYDIDLTRPQLEDLLERRQVLEQLRQALDDLLAIALAKGVQKADIDQVLMVGGSSMIPAIQQLVVSYFGRSRVKRHKPFDAVAHGALALSQIHTLDDYLHHSYAIRLWDAGTHAYSYYSLFERGQRYPCQRSAPLILQVAQDGQQEIRLDIGEVAEVTQAEVTYDLQGRMTSTELRRQDMFRSLDGQRHPVCMAHLQPPGRVGSDRISVQFEVNDQRILLATVTDLLTHHILIHQQATATLS